MVETSNRSQISVINERVKTFNNCRKRANAFYKCGM